jgi:cysteine synthase
MPSNRGRELTLLDMIGGTRLIPLRHIVPEGSARILLKLEYENPTGSMKDRMALAMVAAAEADGPLQPGGSVVEYTGVARACRWPLCARRNESRCRSSPRMRSARRNGTI